MGTVLSGVAVLGMAVALLLVPLGVPGVWIMLGILLVATLAGGVPLGLWIGLAILALLAEGLEWALLQWMGRRYGGSSRAFWGAVAGGVAGVVVGLPIPVLGPLLAGFLGTFAGAGVVTFLETRSVSRASRVGWGVLLARTFAVGLKVAAGLVVLVIGSIALFAA
jgi:uncharacterized protein YqgC (DUF456 family)